MAQDEIPFTRVVRDLPASVPFVGPEAIQRENRFVFRARIGANESAFGVSPKAAEAMRQAVTEISWYGDSESFELREALAENHGVAPEEICVGAGIDELLGNVVRMTVTPDTPVVTSLGAYPTFNYHVAGFGGVLHRVPYERDHEDLESLLAAAEESEAPLVYLSNPDNPMGTWHDAEAVQRFIDGLPRGRLLVLDEAYIDFAPAGTAPAIDTSDPRVIRMRTFSKAHGMAGARIGYAIAHKELITGLNKIRNHFGVNRIAQVGALASLQDEAFISDVIEAVEAGKQDYYALAQRLGLAALPSAANFVAIDVGGGKRAREILKALLRHQVFVRMPGVAPLDRCIRVTVGRPDEREIFAEALEKVLDEVPEDNAGG